MKADLVRGQAVCHPFSRSFSLEQCHYTPFVPFGSHNYLYTMLNTRLVRHQHHVRQVSSRTMGMRLGGCAVWYHGNGRNHVISYAQASSTSPTDANTNASNGSDTEDTDAVNIENNMEDSAIPSKAVSRSSRMALAAKISAARSLARKMAEEKQAAAAAANLASKSAVDPETAAELIRSAELEVAELAKEAAEADAKAREAVKAEFSSTNELELRRLKEENAALEELVRKLAADRAEAEKRLEEVKKKGSEASVVPSSKTKKAAPSRSKKISRKETQKEVSEETLLLEMVQKANAAGQRTATLPDGAAALDSSIKVLYNVNAGPLPHDSAAPILKMGLNRWESQLKIPMSRVSSLDGEGAWFAAEVLLPKLLFRVDFVIEDASSGAVDNNGGKDFILELLDAPTPEEVTESRLILLEEFESASLSAFKAEEDKIEAEILRQAKIEAKSARENYIQQRREKLLAEAKEVVRERREGIMEMQVSKSSSVPGVFMWKSVPKPGTISTLFYNSSSGPLSEADSIVLHIGYDNWWLKDKRVIPMRPATAREVKAVKLTSNEASQEKWWIADVPIWNTAAVLDFVFANDARTYWDNAGGTDFHTEIDAAATEDDLIEMVFKTLESASAEEAKKGESLTEKRFIQRAALKVQAARQRRELRRQVLYTEPTTPKAGKRLKVFYNPDKTSLRGRPDVFVRGGFNRWSHEKIIAPICMQPAVPDAGGLGFYYAEIDVPSDAHTLDVVFMDSADEHGGFYDNNAGLDYHIPIEGSEIPLPQLKIVHISSEMAPIAKAGGLGDVVTALGRAVQDEGHAVEVVLPKYDCIDYSQVEDLVLDRDFWCDGTQVKVWRGIVEGLPTTFLEPCNGLFWQGKIYVDVYEDYHRFGTFCAVALHYLLNDSPKRPDILHCHDWQTAPVAFLDRQGVPAAFTIHNLNYGPDLIGQAMASSEVCTTVSPTYAQEISGHPAIAPYPDKFYGIRNGIDMDIWDPASDPFLPQPFSSEDVGPGKAAAKAELRSRMGLAEGDVPIVGCVTRLTHQKGIHLIRHAAWRATERGAQFVLLGSAPTQEIQNEFDALAEELARQYPERARLWFAYDEPLSHLIYAGADIFLVPSMFEPCGLTQMISMRYGTVPVVRRTGGLADTVFDVDDDVQKAVAAGIPTNGFSFDGADADGMDYALNRALDAWYDTDKWDALRRRCMNIDWSWASPAQDYLELYWRAIKSRK